MATTTISKTHPPASSSSVDVKAGQSGVTVAPSAANTDRVWVSINPMVSIYPWYGTAVSPGGSLTLSAQPGQRVFVHSPSAPASSVITIT